MKLIKGLAAVLLLAVATLPATSWATNGYFTIGYGAKAMGIAGTGTALPQDSLAGAINPAGMAFVGHSADLNVRFFNPNRQASLDTTARGATFDVKDESRRDLFVFPTFGYVRPVSSRLSLGITGYANGGMNSTYDRNLYDETFAVLGAFQQGFGAALVGGASPADAQLAGATAASLVPEGTTTGAPETSVLGIDLGQVILAPTAAFKITENHSLGASLLIGVQRFSARGLGNFAPLTQSGTLDGLTNNGNDWSYGAGFRLGWTGKLHPMVTVGLAGATKIYMTKFDKYDQLFAEDGDFDIPPNVTAGIALHPHPKLTIAFDWQRIFYEDVASISNTGPTLNELNTLFATGDFPESRRLGGNDGLGFGWEDINVLRVGVIFRPTGKLTLRAGYNYNESPIPDDEILFNILAPAVVQHHATFGFSYAPTPSSELNLAYMHAFHEKKSTDVSALGIPASIEMAQNSLDVSFTWKY